MLIIWAENPQKPTNLSPQVVDKLRDASTPFGCAGMRLTTSRVCPIARPASWAISGASASAAWSAATAPTQPWWPQSWLPYAVDYDLAWHNYAGIAQTSRVGCVRCYAPAPPTPLGRAPPIPVYVSGLPRAERLSISHLGPATLLPHQWLQSM